MNKAKLSSLPLGTSFSHGPEGLVMNIVSTKPVKFTDLNCSDIEKYTFTPDEKELNLEVYIHKLPSGYDFYNGQIVEVVDVTPTWQGLLPAMLDLYAQKKNSVFSETSEAAGLRLLIGEFEKMAKAADNWNEHIKKINS